MQMRHKAGISKRNVKEGGDGNPAKPGNNRIVTTTLGLRITPDKMNTGQSKLKTTNTARAR